MKDNYKIGQRVILSRTCSCLAGTIFEKGDEVTISEIDPVLGYGFTDEEDNRIIQCGWDCIERVADEIPEESSDDLLSKENLENAKQASLAIFDTMVVVTGVKSILSNKFNEESVELIMEGFRNAFMTGFDCCSEYVASVLQD